MSLPVTETLGTEVFTENDSRSSNRKQKFLKYFAGITQFLSWPIIFILFHLFFKLKMNGLDNIRKMSSPFIIISNHVSFYDSFVFRLIVGPFPKNLPLRFMAVDTFRYWYLNLLSTLFITNIIYALFGAFVIIKGRGIDKNLEESLKIINNDGNIVLYPEGRMIKDGRIGNFKLGAAVLAKKTNVPVIPVAMKIDGKGLRKNYIIKIGKIVSYDKDASPDYITNTFRENIVNLHN